jgi:hypothetical protein
MRGWVCRKHFHERSAELQVPPLRYAPVGMTPLFGNGETAGALGRHVAQPLLHLLVADEACLLEDCAASR